MPKMTHWNSPDPIDVSPEKAAVYAAQGWVTSGAKAPKVQPAVTREATTEGVVEEPPAKPVKKTAAKKTAAKKPAAKKAAKKPAKKAKAPAPVSMPSMPTPMM